MYKIEIPLIKDCSIDKQEKLLEHKIKQVNWAEDYSYQPDVRLIISHAENIIYLKFVVNEDAVMARVTEDNGDVWTDSCVEFFISFDETGYYNFEFNCIGTLLIRFQKEKNIFELASKEVLDTVIRKSSLGTIPFEEKTGNQSWELSVAIPVTAFFKHKIESLSGLKVRCNFYKCGDNLSKPHFLSWSPINYPVPNFHIEEFFGEGIFSDK